MGLRKKIKSIKLKDSVLFWRWINAKIIAIVTKIACYHWSIEKNFPPRQQFSHTQGEIQILNYEQSQSGDWLLLRGIAKNKTGIYGKLTVYQKSKGKMQTIEAYGGCLAQITLDGKNSSNTFLCCCRIDLNVTKLFIKEIEGNNPSFIKTV